ncbi:MAG: site-specific integrase [Vicinamibacteria bacterium]
MAARPSIRIQGPLAPYQDGLWSYLLGQGYARLSSVNLLRVMSHLSRWLESQGLELGKLTWALFEAFVRERRQAGYTHFLSLRALSPIMKFLEGKGVVSLPVLSLSPLDKLLNGYARFLTEERALQPTTVKQYKTYARMFLSEKLGSECLELSRIKAEDVSGFILGHSRTFSIASTKVMVTALRSVFRFLHLRGSIGCELADAVPGVAGWRQAGLPKFILPRQLQQLLSSCDRRTHVGRRDFAVMLLLARLGLRSCEVEALELDDVDWRAGETVLRGKGHSDARLPLPSDVGEAIAGYLQRGRPRSTSRAVFLTSRAPYHRLSRVCITAIVSQAAARAGLPRMGAHRLRHTAATQMLRHGASLTEIAQVLRHRSLDTTAIYAKVDRTTLRELAPFWPGGAA